MKKTLAALALVGAACGLTACNHDSPPKTQHGYAAKTCQPVKNTDLYYRCVKDVRR